MPTVTMTRPTYDEGRVTVWAGNVPAGDPPFSGRYVSKRQVKLDGFLTGTVYGFQPTINGMSTAYLFEPNDSNVYGLYAGDLGHMRKLLAAWKPVPLKGNAVPAARTAKATHTPLRNVRVPDKVWDAAIEGTAAEGTNVSAVINAFLRERYVDGTGTKSKAEIEAKLAELHERCRTGKLRPTGVTVVTSEIRALEWVLGILDTHTDKEHVL